MNFIKNIEEKLPLYEISKQIRQEYLDAYDIQFYKQIRNFNVIVTIVYNIGVVMELFSGIEGAFLAMDVVFLAVSIFIMTGVIYAHYSNKIMINYWLCIVL